MYRNRFDPSGLTSGATAADDQCRVGCIGVVLKRLTILALLFATLGWGQQYALPIADETAASGWSQVAGDGDGDFWEEFDEGFGAGRGSGSGPDDATTAWEGFLDAATIETTLSSVTDPTVHTGHIVRTRNRKDQSGGQTIDIFVAILEGVASRQSQNFPDVNDTWTTRGFTMLEGSAANIGSYTDLQILTRHNEVGGGQPRRTQESAHELEVPDAGGGPSPRFVITVN